ncbi:BTB/POZ domain-containing protein KCTD14-like [Nematostella vectensis]|uniref:BTB/POZ domain-containing protein KCTD14-like n=1 Tax=Nematostella vectensis TaxID=45351 RepID=UPI0020770813|nr:BTB/POZ domain-containing protein KCTD14-like [Nematostella vectensis]
MGSEDIQKIPAVVTLNVGGHFFTTRLSTLKKDQDSMLASMFSGRFNLDVDSEGRFFIDRDGTYFGFLLNYLRDPSQLPPASVAMQVYREAQYYRIEGLMAMLECYPAVIPIGRLDEQKAAFGEDYYMWKQTILETVRQKYGDILRYSLGQDCMVTCVRYISKEDFLTATSDCKHTISTQHVGTTGVQEQEFYQHNFFCSDEGGRLGFFIGPEIPMVDFIIAEKEIKDVRLFTSVLEKDLRHEGFCVSGRSSHTWKCSRCDIKGYLHQMAFRWSFLHGPQAHNHYGVQDQ